MFAQSFKYFALFLPFFWKIGRIILLSRILISFMKGFVYENTIFYIDVKIQKWGMVFLVFHFQL